MTACSRHLQRCRRYRYGRWLILPALLMWAIGTQILH